MNSIGLLYSTAPDLQTAERIAAALVEDRLAACVNIIPGMRSIYRWEGATAQADEFVLIIKTSAVRSQEAAAKIRSLHPHDTPAIVEIVSGPATDERFASWILAETSP